MIRSMTGYGKAEAVLETGRIIVEVRSVNHRYGEIFVKLPRTLMPFENDVRKCVAGRLKRGKIEVFVQQEGGVAAGARPVANLELAAAYHEAFLKMRTALGLHEPVTLSLIAAQKDVLGMGEREGGTDGLLEELLAAVSGAVDSIDVIGCGKAPLSWKTWRPGAKPSPSSSPGCRDGRRRSWRKPPNA